MPLSPSRWKRYAESKYPHEREALEYLKENLPDSDPVLPLETGERFAAALGARIDHVIADAGHFLQEDAGPHIGSLVADWLAS